MLFDFFIEALTEASWKKKTGKTEEEEVAQEKCCRLPSLLTPEYTKKTNKSHSGSES